MILVHIFFLLMVVFLLVIAVDYLNDDPKASFLLCLLTGMILILWYWTASLKIIS